MKKPNPEGNKKNVSMTLSPKVIHFYKEKAKENKRTFSDMVNYDLEELNCLSTPINKEVKVKIKEY